MKLRRIDAARYHRGVRVALLAFGALNAILYAGLLPLWEGFDEPFHYAYVQDLENMHSLPVQRQSTMSEEVWQSFPLAPASYLVKRNLPMVTTFEDYSHLPPEEQLALRRRLENLDPRLAAAPSGAMNYESQQAPLAYAALLPFNWLWSRSALPRRVLYLRLVCAFAAVSGTGFLLFRLATLLGFAAAGQHAAAFLIFCSQMFYATSAHIANDWLALPLFLLLVTSAVELYVSRSRSALIALTLALAAGLLTKAYFLAMIPYAIAVMFRYCRRRDALLFSIAALVAAAPFYVRNIVLYKSIDAQQQNIGGTRFGELFEAAFRLPWLHSLGDIGKKSLWYGNNSGVAFSATTLSIMLLLLVFAVVFYVRRRPSPAEYVVLAGIACFAAALTYNTVLEYYTTRGLAITTAPWYVELLWPPVLCLLMSRAPKALRAALCLLGAYIISATYVAKLIPLYGGYSGHPAHLGELAGWYTTQFTRTSEILSTTALISPAVIWLLTLAVVAASLTLAIRIALSNPEVTVIAKPSGSLRPQ
ncbi:MAG TPA: hypothetical protein VKE70_19500 [Candidatus Solibacter sp.]|nr:hypothetical protein [Candidatus Solibacter sp.]